MNSSSDLSRNSSRDSLGIIIITSPWIFPSIPARTSSRILPEILPRAALVMHKRIFPAIPWRIHFQRSIISITCIWNTMKSPSGKSSKIFQTPSQIVPPILPGILPREGFLRELLKGASKYFPSISHFWVYSHRIISENSSGSSYKNFSRYSPGNLPKVSAGFLPAVPQKILSEGVARMLLWVPMDILQSTPMRILPGVALRYFLEVSLRMLLKVPSWSIPAVLLE